MLALASTVNKLLEEIEKLKTDLKVTSESYQLALDMYHAANSDEFKSSHEIFAGAIVYFYGKDSKYKIIESKPEKYFIFKLRNDGSTSTWNKYEDKEYSKEELFNKIKNEYHKVLK